MTLEKSARKILTEAASHQELEDISRQHSYHQSKANFHGDQAKNPLKGKPGQSIESLKGHHQKRGDHHQKVADALHGLMQHITDHLKKDLSKNDYNTPSPSLTTNCVKPY